MALVLDTGPLHAGVLLALLDDIAGGACLIEDLHTEDYRRIRDICGRYADADIGFVDASVGHLPAA